MKTLVIIPTYNECENISPIILAILKEQPQLHILVVDDGSPDGTADIVSRISKEDERVHLLPGHGKGGLGKAYLRGFDWALKHGYEACLQMDADFSHRPVDLKPMVTALKDYDFVIGSRYTAGYCASSIHKLFL